MLRLADIEQGDWLCINMYFPTEDLMRSLWKECYGIEMHEVQDNTTKPAPRLRLPGLGTRPNQVSRKMSKEMDMKLSKQLAQLAEPGSSKINTCMNIDNQSVMHEVVKPYKEQDNTTSQAQG